MKIVNNKKEFLDFINNKIEEMFGMFDGSKYKQLCLIELSNKQPDSYPIGVDVTKKNGWSDPKVELFSI